ncbi:MAG: Sir2 family NAD-dependent protein deacetylase [Negativicutes bacterium]|jgi:NAD-dependent deacetylase
MQEINLLAEKLRSATNLLILTGAGMSTACGIPDFRSPTGIWNGPNGKRNQYLFSRDGFTYAQAEFFIAFKKMYTEFREITSDEPYEWLRKLGDSGLEATIVTQNIDGLHKRFTSENFIVYELHGTAATMPCLGCGKKYSTEQVLELYNGIEVPKTPCCNRRFDTDITLFGDGLPNDFDDLMRRIDNFDFLLVMGSSLEVAPVNMIPRYFSHSNKAIINLQTTSVDSEFGIVIHADISECLQELFNYWRLL